MGKIRFSPKLTTGIVLALFFGIALSLRVFPFHNWVFSGDWIKFTGTDAYYHMRLVDSLVHNFPRHITFDPYIYYPYGNAWSYMPFFDWLLAGTILLVGLGSPAQHTIDVVGAYFPAVLGALTVIPVYFIGKELFSRWAGVLSAGLIAVLPGEFLGRSILGFTDHHVAETLFSTVALLFLILATKSARQRQLTFSHLKRRNWAITGKPLVYGLLAGISLGVYLLSWIGGLLFIFIIFIYFIVQFIIDHLRHKSTDYLCWAGVIPLFVALVMFLPFSPGNLHLISLIIALFTPLVLSGISRLMVSRKIKPAYYPLTLVGLGLAGLVLFRVISPSLFSLMLSSFRIFTPPSGIGLTITEVLPLLSLEGEFSLSVAWSNFTTGFLLSFISLGILIYLIIKQGEADKTILVVWSLVTLAATLGERRFAYYFAVNVALLTGYFSWQILEFAGIRNLAAKPAEISKIMKKKRSKRLKKARRATGLTTSHITVALGIIVIFFLVFVPNTGLPPNWNITTKAIAQQAFFTSSDTWHSSLSWLEENTPDPFGDPDFYYALYESPAPGENYDYPESAYGVMAWWDYGHLITRIARRLPNHGPGGGWSYRVGRFFIAQDESSGNKIIEQLDSRYVIIDYDTVMGKFHAVATFAGSSPEEFRDIYFTPKDGNLVSTVLFYPKYYRSLSTRLYNFDGKAVTPQSSMVISYQEKVSRGGISYKEITDTQSFPNYEEAEAYVLKHKSDNYKIVSDNPFISPVPLAALEHYRLIHSSDDSIEEPEVGKIPAIKIFEYVK